MNHPSDLPVSTPEEQGIPSKAISRFIQVVEAKGVPMHSFLAVKNGKLIAEGYWKPFHKDWLHRIYSSSKSFVSIAIGFLESEGKIALGDSVCAHFPEKLPAEGVHPYIGKMTIRDLLMMASPHAKTTYKMMEMDDWVKTFFIYPPSHLPGTVFSYDTSATHVLGALVEKIEGMPFLDYLRPRLLDHLGFSGDARCLTDPMGISWSGSAVLCTLRDFAKVALTCMQVGRYNGKQLIPERYIREATSRQITNFVTGSYMDAQQGYGYQFWCLRNNAFAFLGMGGQIAVCIPDRDFLLVSNADDQLMSAGHAIVCDALWDEIYPYLDEANPLPPNGEEYGQLQNILESLSFQTVEGGRTSSLIPSIEGKTYRMDSNGMKLQSMSFSFDPAGGVIHFSKESGDHQLRFGYGENQPQKFPEYGYGCITSGAWWNANTLNVACFIADEYYAPLRMTVYFKDDTVTVHMNNAAEQFLEEYSGFASGTAQ